MIRIQCPSCERTLSIKDTSTGEVKVCPACGKKFRVPKAPANSENLRPASDPKTTRPTPPPDEEEVYEDLEVVEGCGQGEEDEGIQEKPGRLSESKKKYHSADYEEVDDLDQRPRRRKVRKRRIRFLEDKEEAVDVFSWVSPFMLFLAGLVLTWCLISGLSLVTPHGIRILTGLGICLLIAGEIWVLVIAAREGDLLYCVIIPFYVYVFIIQNISETWKPALLQVISILIFFSTFLLVVFHVAQEDLHHDPAPIHHHHHQPLDDLDN